MAETVAGLDPAAIALDGPARGEGFLSLLADVRSMALMRCVREAPLERKDLLARVGFDGSAFDRSMRRLTEMGLIVGMAMPDDRRRRGYYLTHGGRDLLAIDMELDRRLEAFDTQEEDPKALLVKSIADPWDRAVTRVVLEAPQRFNDLSRMAYSAWRPGGAAHASQLSPSRLTMRVDRLRRLGLVECQPSVRPGSRLYAPGENIWRLGRVAALMALWRWRWTPERVPRTAGDLAGLVRMLAARVRASQATGICVVMHAIAPSKMEGWPDVIACVTEGRMSMSELTLPTPDAHARATPRVWLQALLGGKFDAIEIEGDTIAAHTVLSGLAQVLSA